MNTQYLTEAQEADFGLRIATILKLRRDHEHKDRWQTTWGTKTNLGLFRSFVRIVDEIQTGELKP